jgi:hypothetical protein
MTTTKGFKNTRVSDLNKIIAKVDEWKKARPELVPGGKDPETDFMQIVTLAWLSQFDVDQWSGMYLWAAANGAAIAVLEMAEEIGVEDLTLFDRFMSNMPLMVAATVLENTETLSMDMDGLHQYGNTLVSDYINENLTPEEAWAEAQ